MPVHFGLWLERLNKYGRETGLGVYVHNNPTDRGLVILRNISNKLSKFFKIVPGNIIVEPKSEVEINFMATGKWKICSFTEAQFGLWTLGTVGIAYAEDVSVPVRFSLSWLPGTLNCTKFVAESITLALPISILPI